MGFKYLGDANWSDITRDERYFCSHLYHHILKDVMGFVSFLHNSEVYSFTEEELKQRWEIGFEVCFYRDFIKKFKSKQRGDLLRSHKNKKGEYSPKRTFDLCLFGPSKIIIIEAKAQGRFNSKQNTEFEKDEQQILQLIKDPSVQVDLIALASSKYFSNMDNRKKPLPKVIQAHNMNWKMLFDYYKEDVFKNADESYGK